MCEAAVSNPVILFLRMLTSWEMQSDQLRYAEVVSSLCGKSHCLRDLMDQSTFGAGSSQAVKQLRNLKDYCLSVVEHMGEEADQWEVTALSRCLRVPIEVVSIAGQTHYISIQHPGSDMIEHIPSACLLYRAGHYDVLYKDRLHK